MAGIQNTYPRRGYFEQKRFCAFHHARTCAEYLEEARFRLMHDWLMS